MEVQRHNEGSRVDLLCIQFFIIIGTCESEMFFFFEIM